MPQESDHQSTQSHADVARLQDLGNAIAKSMGMEIGTGLDINQGVALMELMQSIVKILPGEYTRFEVDLIKAQQAKRLMPPSTHQVVVAWHYRFLSHHHYKVSYVTEVKDRAFGLGCIDQRELTYVSDASKESTVAWQFVAAYEETQLRYTLDREEAFWHGRMNQRALTYTRREIDRQREMP